MCCQCSQPASLPQRSVPSTRANCTCSVQYYIISLATHKKRSSLSLTIHRFKHIIGAHSTMQMSWLIIMCVGYSDKTISAVCQLYLYMYMYIQCTCCTCKHNVHVHACMPWHDLITHTHLHIHTCIHILYTYIYIYMYMYVRQQNWLF